jgi:hypothetical protein
MSDILVRDYHTAAEKFLETWDWDWWAYLRKFR